MCSSGGGNRVSRDLIESPPRSHGSLADCCCRGLSVLLPISRHAAIFERVHRPTDGAPMLRLFACLLLVSLAAHSDSPPLSSMLSSTAEPPPCVTAAVQVSRMGKTVVLLEPKRQIGGLTISGLGFTDTGDKRVIGGLAREFYQRVKKHYDVDSAWRQEPRDKYDRYRATDDAMWTFEPHVARRVFQQMLEEAHVPVVTGAVLDRSEVSKANGRITAIRLTSGESYTGKFFIDTSYEGDLMAAAGVSFTVGREANSQYGETLNGVQVARSSITSSSRMSIRTLIPVTRRAACSRRFGRMVRR